MMDLPLFPLHTVLCPGVALPLHVFEERYKTMVQRCLAAQSPFGVVLIREGREVGPGDLAVAGVGTVAEIREATRYPDGRYDLVTIIEAPSEEVYARISLSLGSIGAIRTESLRAFPEAEYRKIIAALP